MVKYTIEKKLKHHVIEWVATFLSIFGALLVSLKFFEGYYIWIVANILWMIFAFRYKHYGLLTLSISYFIINCIGIIRWQFY
jgi:nicotinamide riboside transporter PnuC